ncbi:hypothetical protein [Alkaliflexus imshenetskii]|jgi:hypothetical protein|uniref:hypothetical protein n=1 Tax=Alkaliflexus imshenetskii TaxID=286730 RepID=UPI00047D7FF3|nr:hypothetical protein [Alkaliflexus imshenetskii]
MNSLIFSFKGRKTLSSAHKSWLWLVAVVNLGFATFVSVKHGFQPDMLISYSGFIVGLFSLVFVLYGKSLRVEKSYISADSNIIQFKNTYKTPVSLRWHEIADVVIHKTKIEFVNSRQLVHVYDISVYPEDDADRIKADMKLFSQSLPGNRVSCFDGR